MTYARWIGWNLKNKRCYDWARAAFYKKAALAIF